MDKFYKTFDEIKDNRYDGMIITGAPVEHLEFEEVDYWQELCVIMEWSKKNVYSTFHICWGLRQGFTTTTALIKEDLTKRCSVYFLTVVLMLLIRL